MKNKELCKRRIKLKYDEYLCGNFLIHIVAHKSGSGYNSWEVEDLDGNHIGYFPSLTKATKMIVEMGENNR